MVFFREMGGGGGVFHTNPGLFLCLKNIPFFNFFKIKKEKIFFFGEKKKSEREGGGLNFCFFF